MKIYSEIQDAPALLDNDFFVYLDEELHVLNNEEVWGRYKNGRNVYIREMEEYTFSIGHRNNIAINDGWTANFYLKNDKTYFFTALSNNVYIFSYKEGKNYMSYEGPWNGFLMNRVLPVIVLERIFKIESTMGSFSDYKQYLKARESAGLENIVDINVLEGFFKRTEFEKCEVVTGSNLEVTAAVLEYVHGHLVKIDGKEVIYDNNIFRNNVGKEYRII
jgi:hypothetical protein